MGDPYADHGDDRDIRKVIEKYHRNAESALQMIPDLDRAICRLLGIDDGVLKKTVTFKVLREKFGYPEPSLELRQIALRTGEMSPGAIR